MLLLVCEFVGLGMLLLGCLCCLVCEFVGLGMLLLGCLCCC